MYGIGYCVQVCIGQYYVGCGFDVWCEYEIGFVFVDCGDYFVDWCWCIGGLFVCFDWMCFQYCCFGWNVVYVENL